MAQNAHSFRIGSHDAVLDAIVDHLDEVTGAVCSAMQVTELGGTADILAPGRARDVSRAGRQCLEYWVEVSHSRVRPADHHAVTALQPPDAAAGSDVDVIDALRVDVARPADVLPR